MCEFRTNKKTKEIYNNYVFIKINKILPHSMNSSDYLLIIMCIYENYYAFEIIETSIER